jgi:hypothetical protein
MSMSSYEIRASELPASVLNLMSSVVIGFSTPLIKVALGAGRKLYAKLIGSGTFVNIEGIQGIITAQHVAQEMDHSSETGIVLKEHEHRFTVKNQFLTIIQLTENIVPGNGPDLAFIKLPTSIAAEISSYKSFINLSSDRGALLSKPPELHSVFWVAYGSPEEWLKTETSTSRPGETISLCGYCSIGGLNLQYEKEGYDYYEMELDYTSSDAIPKSLGGFSGGGLWQITLKGSSHDNLKPDKYFLSGVAFYQSELKDQKRMLRCHGRLSIYNSLYNQVFHKCA